MPHGVTKEDADNAKSFVDNYKQMRKDNPEEAKRLSNMLLQPLIDHGIIQDTNYYKKYFDDILFEDKEMFKSEYKYAFTYEPDFLMRPFEHFAAFLYPRLKEYRDFLAENTYNYEPIEDLDKMILAFRIILAKSFGDPEYYCFDPEVCKKKIKKGLKLFSKYFEEL